MGEGRDTKGMEGDVKEVKEEYQEFAGVCRKRASTERILNSRGIAASADIQFSMDSRLLGLLIS